jgi:hypothetical protein
MNKAWWGGLENSALLYFTLFNALDVLLQLLYNDFSTIINNFAFSILDKTEVQWKQILIYDYRADKKKK